MNTPDPYKILNGALVAIASIALMSVGVALAQAEDSRFEFSADRTNVAFYLKQAPRSQVLNELFAGSGIEIRWIDSGYADERMVGELRGTSAEIARQLLGRTNFVVVHDENGLSPRVVRVLIVGPAKGEQSSSGLAALVAELSSATESKAPQSIEMTGDPTAKLAGVQPGSPSVPADSPQPSWLVAGQIDRPTIPSEPGATGNSAGIMTAPPAGVAAPPLVPPLGAKAPQLLASKESTTELPLIPVAPGTVDPALRPVSPGQP